MSDLIVRFEDLFRDELLTKLADHKLPRDTNKWQEAIIGVLYSTHPWFQTENLKFDIRKMDPDAGTGVGSLVIEDEIYLPIIIDNFRLKPLDLYQRNKHLKFLTQSNFLRDTVGKDVGIAEKPNKGEIGNVSLWNKVYPPHEGRYSFASMTDPKELKHNILNDFTTQQLAFATKQNPQFKDALKAHLRESTIKEASAAPKATWDILTAERIGHGERGRLNYIHTPNEKLAFFIGDSIVDPATKIIDKALFGVEANSSSPRYFMMPVETDLAVEPIENLEEHGIMKSASAGKHFEAYMVPVEDFTVLVGPFISKFANIDGTETVETMSGKVDIMENPHLRAPMEKQAGLLVLGQGAVRISLGKKIVPLTKDEATLTKNASLSEVDDADVIKPTVSAFKKLRYHYNGEVYYTTDTLIGVLEKEASLDDSAKTRLGRLLRQRKNVYLKKRAGMAKKASAPLPLIKVAGAGIKRTAVFIKPVPAVMVKAAQVKLPAYKEMMDVLKKEAQPIEEEDVSNTVDAILSLNVVTPENMDKYVSKVGDLEGAEETCANLLLLARLGFPLEEQPLKTALSSLNEVTRQLRMMKNTSQTTFDSVV